MNKSTSQARLKNAEHGLYPSIPRSLAASVTLLLSNSARPMSGLKRSSRYFVVFGIGIVLWLGQLALVAAAEDESFKSVFAKNLSERISTLRKIRSAISARWSVGRQQEFIQALVKGSNGSEVSPLASVTMPEPVIKSRSKTNSENSIEPIVGATFKYDSNLLRLADNSVQKTQSEIIKQIRAGIAARWNFKRQQLLVQAVVQQNWFSTYHELDYLAHDVSVQWNWQVGSQLKGELGYQHKRDLGDFGQQNQLRLDNFSDQADYFARGAYQFAANWAVSGGLLRKEFSFSDVDGRFATGRQVRNRREDGADIGLRYITSNDNMLGFTFGIAKVLFPEREFTPGAEIDNQYLRKHYDLDWRWNYSVKTQLAGRVGYLQHTAKNLSQYDFDNMTARLNANWEMSSKTALQVSLWRDVSFSGNTNSSFVLEHGMKFTPTWLANPKFSLDLPISYVRQEYAGNPGVSKLVEGAEKDDIFTVSLNAFYKPFEHTQIGAYVGYEQRDSTALSRTYDSTMAGLDLQIKF